MKGKAKSYRFTSIAESTRKSRASQWGIYKQACERFNWPVFPCDVTQAFQYVAFLAEKLKFSTIKLYYQAVVFFHVCAGFEPVRMSNPVHSATLRGIERSKSEDSNGKDPILPNHLRLIMAVTRKSSELELLVFVAALLMLPTLLRVSHVVQSVHDLKVEDVTFFKGKCLVRVNSSKTTKGKDDSSILPVLISKDPRICAASWLLYMFRFFDLKSGSYLFSSPSIPVLTYSMFARKFKELVARAGIWDDFASHSLRRGGTTFMSMLERPIDQIKARGLRKSDCVYRYIVPPMSSKLAAEQIVAANC